MNNIYQCCQVLKLNYSIKINLSNRKKKKNLICLGFFMLLYCKMKKIIAKKKPTLKPVYLLFKKKNKIKMKYKFKGSN